MMPNLGISQRIADAEAWNAWAATINQRALERGLVTAEELVRNRRSSRLALERLRSRLEVEP